MRCRSSRRTPINGVGGSSRRKRSDDFRRRVKAAGIGPVISHASYLINLASVNPAPPCAVDGGDGRRDRSRRGARPAADVVLHPGAYTVGRARLRVWRQSRRACWNCFGARTRGRTMVLLEHTAGQGTALGATFEQLAAIIDAMKGHRRVGVCLDTCHLLASGYDLCSPEGYASTFRQFGRRGRVRSSEGVSPERLQEAARQPRRSARAHRPGPSRARTVSPDRQRSPFSRAADAARDAEGRGQTDRPDHHGSARRSRISTRSADWLGAGDEPHATAMLASGMPPGFTREQVMAMAALANLELEPAEIELFARQLGDILAYADEVQQVDTTGVPPTASAHTTDHRPRRRAATVARPRRSRSRPRRTRRSMPASSKCLGSLDDRSRLDGQRGARRGAFRCAQRHRRVSRCAGANRCAEPAAERVQHGRRRAGAGASRRDRQRPRSLARRAARRRAGGDQGQHLHARRAHDGLVARFSSASSRRTTRQWSRASKRPARSSSARPTATSSRWARPTRTRRSGRRAIRGRSIGFPAGPAADRPRRSRPGWRRSRSARTPAARSVSRRRSAAWSDSSRPTDACRGMA